MCVPQLVPKHVHFMLLLQKRIRNRELYIANERATHKSAGPHLATEKWLLLLELVPVVQLCEF